MSVRLSAALAALVLLAGCSTATPKAPAPAAPVAPVAAAPVATTAADDNLNAVAWSQTAIEHDLIYLQTYRDAQSRLLAALADKQWDALPKDDRASPVFRVRQ